MEGNIPHYDLKVAKSLARNGPMSLNDRVRRFVLNRYGVLDVRGFWLACSMRFHLMTFIKAPYRR